MSTPVYSYQLFDKSVVLELYRYKPQLHPNASLATLFNGELEAIRTAVAAGYRWIRSEGETAVFEKQCPSSGTPVIPIPRHIAAAVANFKEAIPS